MSKEIEHLLKPRYRLMKHYPGNGTPVGTIFDFSGYDERSGVTIEQWQTTFGKFPHIFKSIAWWEERSIEEMPEYVKWIEFSPLGSGRRLNDAGKIEKAKPIQRGNEIVFEIESCINSIRAEYFLPSDESEFLTQKQQPLK